MQPHQVGNRALFASHDPNNRQLQWESVSGILVVNIRVLTAQWIINNGKPEAQGPHRRLFNSLSTQLHPGPELVPHDTLEAIGWSVWISTWDAWSLSNMLNLREWIIFVLKGGLAAWNNCWWWVAMLLHPAARPFVSTLLCHWHGRFWASGLHPCKIFVHQSFRCVFKKSSTGFQSIPIMSLVSWSASWFDHWSCFGGRRGWLFWDTLGFQNTCASAARLNSATNLVLKFEFLQGQCPKFSDLLAPAAAAYSFSRWVGNAAFF